VRAISLFSGVGGFELGFDRAGIDTLLQVEIDPVCLSVLERHWPDTERLDDVRSVGTQDWQYSSKRHARLARWVHTRTHESSGSVDLVYGGFPCQDVSVAGQRAGLSGQRSSLWFEFERVLSELRPRWCVIENVPGLLSSNAGRDFARILMGLGELGYGWAYRVLDARWFGVPQRRRRVFIVGCLGDQARAQAVLAVCESCGGHPAPRRKTRQDLAPTLDDGARGTSLDLPMLSDAEPNGLARPLVARESGYRMDLETENFLVANAVRASEGHHGHSSGRGDGADNLVVASTLSGGGHPGSNLPGRHKEDDENLVLADPISAHEGKTYTHEGRNNFRLHNVVAYDDRNQHVDGQHQTLRPAGLQRSDVVAFDWQQPGDARYRPVRAGDYTGALSETRVDAVSYSAGVRRLTPRECNRLQGFPDDWDRYGADGKEIADSHRYRCMGNAVCVPVAEWLGHRLIAVDAC